MNDDPRRARWVQYCLCLALLFALLLEGCARRELPFEIVHQDLGIGYAPTDPDFFVIAGPKDIETLETLDTLERDTPLPRELAEKLATQDYQQSFVVVIFRGFLYVQSTAYSVVPRQILHYGDRVVVRIDFGTLDPPDSPVRQAVSSPYLVLAVPKAGLGNQDIRFVLEVDGKEAKEHTFFIP